jgi:hypothetical protein
MCLSTFASRGPSNLDRVVHELADVAANNQEGASIFLGVPESCQSTECRDRQKLPSSKHILSLPEHLLAVLLGESPVPAAGQ